MAYEQIKRGICLNSQSPQFRPYRACRTFTRKAIVSREVFEVVQRNREQAASTSIQSSKSACSENIFRGIVFCPYCGKTLHRQKGTRKKGADVYRFHCIANSRLGEGACSKKSFSITETELRKKVVDYLRQQSSASSDGNVLVEQSDLLLKTRQSEVQKQVSQIKQDVEKKQRFLLSLYENLVKGIIAKDEYISMKASYEAQITALMNSLVELETGLKEYASQVEKTVEQTNSIRSVKSNGTLTADLVSKLIERIEVYSPDEVKVVTYVGVVISKNMEVR